MNTTLTKFYSALSENTGKETAEILSSYIDMKVEKTVTESNAHLVTKDELSQVKSDIIKWIVSLFITTTILIIGLYLKK